MYETNEYDVFPTIENIHLWNWKWRYTPSSELRERIFTFF